MAQPQVFTIGGFEFDQNWVVDNNLIAWMTKFELKRRISPVLVADIAWEKSMERNKRHGDPLDKEHVLALGVNLTAGDPMKMTVLIQDMERWRIDKVLKYLIVIGNHRNAAVREWQPNSKQIMAIVLHPDSDPRYVDALAYRDFGDPIKPATPEEKVHNALEYVRKYDVELPEACTDLGMQLGPIRKAKRRIELLQDLHDIGHIDGSDIPVKILDVLMPIKDAMPVLVKVVAIWRKYAPTHTEIKERIVVVKAIAFEAARLANLVDWEEYLGKTAASRAQRKRKDEAGGAKNVLHNRFMRHFLGLADVLLKGNNGQPLTDQAPLNMTVAEPRTIRPIWNELDHVMKVIFKQPEKKKDK